MKRLLCKLGFHSWTAWHRVPTGVTLDRGYNGGVIFTPRRPYRLTRHCYDCPKEEFRSP